MDIYALCEPETGEIRYIGKANVARKRFSGHIRDARKANSPVRRWFLALMDAGKLPTLRILETVVGDWRGRERLWILGARVVGLPILNKTEGGDQPAPRSKESLAENGCKNARAIHDDPKRKRIWKLKRDMGQLLKEGHVSEGAKEKLRYAAMKRPDLFGEWATI